MKKAVLHDNGCDVEGPEGGIEALDLLHAKLTFESDVLAVNRLKQKLMAAKIRRGILWIIILLTVGVLIGALAVFLSSTTSPF